MVDFLQSRWLFHLVSFSNPILVFLRLFYVVYYLLDGLEFANLIDSLDNLNRVCDLVVKDLIGQSCKLVFLNLCRQMLFVVHLLLQGLIIVSSTS